jgi:hypothetical protein
VPLIIQKPWLSPLRTNSMNSCSGVPGQHLHHRGSRLMTIAFKLVAKNKDSRIKVHRLTRYFPDHNDLQTGHFDLRVRLPDDVEVRDRPDVVGRVAVDRDPASARSSSSPRTRTRGSRCTA